jgi:SH3-like domain-containing protein
MRRIVLFAVLCLLVFAVEASAKRLVVSVKRANVRSGPGTNHDILLSVETYYPFDVLKKSGRWYKIRDFEGDVGWMHGSLLRQIPAVIVKGRLVNVREKPGTTFRILLQAERGVCFKRLGQKGKWLKVRHADGEVGWIHKSLVW